MKLLLKIVLIVIVSLSSCKSQHVTLVGSPLLPVDNDYRVYLAAQDLTENSIVNVTLRSDPDYEFSKVYEGVSGDISEEINFNLPQNRPSTYKLNIVHRNKATNVCMKQSVIIEDNLKHHLIFIHHDKPVYKNGDTIKFRTFVLDRDMLPYRYTNMSVTILDGKKNVIKILENVKTTKYGTFEDYVIVADSPNFGVWRIQVDVDGKTRSKHFPVKHHEENKFEVLVKSTDKEVPFEDRFVFLFIQAKHPVNKVFSGVAQISSSARFDGKDDPVIVRFVKNVTLPVDKNVIKLKIEDELGIRSPTADMIVTLTVDVIEDKTRHNSKVIVDVPLRTFRNRLHVIRNPFFKPGFDYAMTLKARTLNDEPDMSLRTLTMIVDYEEFNEETHTSSTRKETFVLNLQNETYALNNNNNNNDNNTFILNLKNGEIEVFLHPTDITRLIKVIFEFGDTELTERVEKIPNNGVNEYMQATIENKKPLYDPTETLQITARSSNVFQTLHVLVIGSTGLLSSKNYPEAHNTGTFKFTLQLSEHMSPSAFIIMFYARAEDGVIISDEMPIGLKFTTPNSLEVTPAIQNTKPRDTVNFNLKTAKDSLVFITAVDQNATFLGNGNQISRAFVYSEVIRYMNQNLNGTSSYDFSRFSSFVLQPLVSGVPCNANEMTQHVKMDDEATLEDNLSQRYFPDVWFDKKIEIKSDAGQSIQMQVPNELTSWMIHATAMHPTKGFAVVTKETKVSVFNEIGLRVHTPATIRQAEVLNVEVSVYNFLRTTQDVQIVVIVENGDIMDEKRSNVNGKICKTYTRRNTASASFSDRISGTSMSKTQNLFIQSNQIGKMKIKVAVTGANGVADNIERVVEVQERRHLKDNVLGSYLIDMLDKGSLDKTVMVNLPPNAELLDVYAMFSGNLLGPVLENLELFSNVPMDYREPKTNKFMLAMIVAEYHQARRSNIPIEVMNKMQMGYQETLESLQSEVSNTDSQKSALFYVYSTLALIKAKNFLTVDDLEILKALDYLKTKQIADGSFDDGPAVDMQEASSYRHILTAQITLAFIKYQKYSKRYDDVIARATGFLDATKAQLVTDYEKVLVAYTFSAHGDQESSKFLTSTMKCIFANDPDFHEKTSLYVGIASFLIELKIIENEDPKVEVEWLLRHRRPDGSFYSPHDTLSALHALLTYELSKNINKIGLRASIDGQTRMITDRNEIFNLKLSRNDQYNLNVIGVGFGYATVHYEYVDKDTTNDTQSNFSIKLDTKELGGDMLELTVDVKLMVAGMKTSNLVIVKVEMPSGYEFYGHTDGDHIKKVEYWNDRTMAVFYIELMEANQQYREIIQAVKVYQVEYTAKSTVTVYDYYRPNVRAEIQYDYDLNMAICKPSGSDGQQTTTEKHGIWPFNNIFG